MCHILQVLYDLESQQLDAEEQSMKAVQLYTEKKTMEQRALRYILYHTTSLL